MAPQLGPIPTPALAMEIFGSWSHASVVSVDLPFFPGHLIAPTKMVDSMWVVYWLNHLISYGDSDDLAIMHTRSITQHRLLVSTGLLSFLQRVTPVRGLIMVLSRRPPHQTNIMYAIHDWLLEYLSLTLAKAIDPNLFIEGSSWYLSLGSFWSGIKLWVRLVSWTVVLI